VNKETGAATHANNYANWLRATNGAVQKAQASVTVVVNDDVAYPGPTLAVGPDQVGWHLPAVTVDPAAVTPGEPVETTILTAAVTGRRWRFR